MQVASHITRTFSEDEELTWEDRWHFFRQDARQWLLYVPRLCISFFIKPDHDGIQCTEDLLYQYGQAIKHIPSLLRRLAFKTRTLEDELHEVRSCLCHPPVIAFFLLFHAHIYTHTPTHHRPISYLRAGNASRQSSQGISWLRPHDDRPGYRHWDRGLHPHWASPSRLCRVR